MTAVLLLIRVGFFVSGGPDGLGVELEFGGRLFVRLEGGGFEVEFWAMKS